MFSSPAIAGDTVYIGVGVGDGTLLALDATTGATRWSYRTGAGILSTPSVAGRAVYVGSDDGRVYAFEGTDGASPTRAVYWDEAYASRALLPAHEQVRDHFKRAAYEVLDAAGDQVGGGGLDSRDQFAVGHLLRAVVERREVPDPGPGRRLDPGRLLQAELLKVQLVGVPLRPAA